MLCLIVLCFADSTYGQDSTKVSSEQYWHYQWLKQKEEKENQKTEFLNWQINFRDEFRVFIQAPEIVAVLDTVLAHIVPEHLQKRSEIWLWCQKLRKQPGQLSQR